MTAYNGDNYQGGYAAEPRSPYPPGELGGTPKKLIDRKTLTVALAVGDTIAVGKLPANSMVTDAKVYIDVTLGATGIFDLGHAASTDEDGNAIAVDTDGFVDQADAGGQAVLKRASELSPSLYKRFGEETEVYLTCTEVMDGTVLTGVIVTEIEYVNK